MKLLLSALLIGVAAFIGYFFGYEDGAEWHSKEVADWKSSQKACLELSEKQNASLATCMNELKRIVTNFKICPEDRK